MCRCQLVFLCVFPLRVSTGVPRNALFGQSPTLRMPFRITRPKSNYTENEPTRLGQSPMKIPPLLPSYFHPSSSMLCDRIPLVSVLSQKCAPRVDTDYFIYSQIWFRVVLISLSPTFSSVKYQINKYTPKASTESVRQNSTHRFSLRRFRTRFTFDRLNREKPIFGCFRPARCGFSLARVHVPSCSDTRARPSVRRRRRV